MDREKFLDMLNNADETIDKNYCNNVVNKSLSSIPDANNTTGTLNLLIVMEELAELQQELSKYIRGRDSYAGVIEELADVYLGIKYVQNILGISDELLNKAINVKLDRQANRNKNL